MANEAVTFGRFRLDLDRRELFRDDQPVRLGRRPLDILCELASARGGVISKDELMARLWSGRIVEEGNLHVHVSALRKALDEHGEGHSFVVTVPGRGYRLAGLNGSQPGGSNEPRSGQALPPPDKPSIAVLPFQNMSGDPGQEYFADGMVDEIITVLSRIRWLFVVARTSSFTYKGQAVDVKQVGRELGVRYVLEGSLRKAANRVRITAQLIEAETGAYLWADRFEGSLVDVFELQDHVAIRVASTIGPTLRAAEIRRSLQRRTTDLDAYDLYLRALQQMFRWEKTGYLQALALLVRAIERDQDYGPALSLAAFCHLATHLAGWADDPETDRREGIKLARQALRCANDDAGTLGRAAHVLGYFSDDIDPALALIDRALELHPGSAQAWRSSGFLRLWAGQPDLAIEHFEVSRRLDPRDTMSGTVMGIGLGHFYARRFDEARTMLLRDLQERPGWVPTLRVLAACYAHMGQLEKARSAIDQVRTCTSVLIPKAIHFRNPEHRELYLSGMRLAVGEPDRITRR